MNKPRLYQKYVSEIRSKLKEDLKLKSIMAVPKLVKIVINMGVGEAATDAKALDRAVEDLRAITGQQPYLTRARQAEANFKLKKGMPIGAKVTLRGARMYEFIDRFVNISLPRVRDFRGLPTSGFDGKGNLTIGIKEQIIFPEINFDSVDKIRGMDISFITTAEKDSDAKELFVRLGFPFRKK